MASLEGTTETMSKRIHPVAFAAAAALAFYAADTHAQSAGDVAMARAKAKEGATLLARRQFEAALSACESSRSTEDTPPTQLCVGEAQSGLGRHEDARATYLALSRRPIPTDAPSSWVDAQKDATRLLPQSTHAVVKMQSEEAQRAVDTGDYGLALRLADASLELESGAEGQLVRARALRGLRRAAQAREAYQDLLRLVEGKPAADSTVSAEGVRGELAEFEKQLDKQMQSEVAREENVRRIGLVERANQLLKGLEYNAALDICEAVFKEEPIPEAQLCIARGYQGLNQLPEAQGTFEKLLARGADLPPDVRAAAERGASEIRIKLSPGKLSLTVTPVSGLRVAIDAEPEMALSGPTTVQLRPGSHLIRAAAPGHVPLSDEVTLTHGQEVNLPIELMRLPSYRTGGWVAAGAGVAALGVGAVLLNRVASSMNQLTSVCSADLVCGASQESSIQSLLGLRAGFYASVGVGVAAGVASVALFALQPSDAMRPLATVGFGPGSFTLKGEF